MTAEPRRQLKATIEIGADSWPDLLRAMADIVSEMADERVSSFDYSVGGPCAGWSVRIDRDREWTHDRYFAAIRERRNRGKDE